MFKTKVLGGDDSLTARALVANVLEKLPYIEVVGSAGGAVGSREEVVRLKPHGLNRIAACLASATPVSAIGKPLFKASVK